MDAQCVELLQVMRLQVVEARVQAAERPAPVLVAVDAGCPPDGGGGAVLVSGEHGDVQPMMSAQPSDHGCRFRAEFVA